MRDIHESIDMIEEEIFEYEKKIRSYSSAMTHVYQSVVYGLRLAREIILNEKELVCDHCNETFTVTNEEYQSMLEKVRVLKLIDIKFLYRYCKDCQERHEKEYNQMVEDAIKNLRG